MNVKSEIAHVRFKTRMNGNMKVLTVEEMQSDFAIAALKSNKRSSADNTRFTFLTSVLVVDLTMATSSSRDG